MSTSIKNRQEVWMTWAGDLIEVIHNPCGCCPLSFTVSKGKGFYQSASYAVAYRRDFLKWAKGNGWERLQ